MKPVFLLPGSLTVAAEPTIITTLLGSCVAVALYDEQKGIGGLNHYLLPHQPKDEPLSPRYGDTATELLIKGMLSAGAHPSALRAKVYGGANVLTSIEFAYNIGAGNREIALSILKAHGIPVIEENTGGTRGRRIALNSSTFEVTHSLNMPQLEPPPALVVNDGIEPEAAATAPRQPPSTKHEARNAWARSTDAHQLMKKPVMIIIGGNAGSAESLKTLLRDVSAYLLPVVVADSEAQGQLAAFLSGLRTSGATAIFETITAPTPLQAGHVYFPPAGLHITIERARGSLVVTPKVAASTDAQLPSADALFKSATEASGGAVIAIMLGGRGADGIEGLSYVRKAGGVAIVEKPETAAVPYGPQKAVALGAADHVSRCSEMGHAIMFEITRRTL